MRSVYVHIPFCETKCGYCDFLSFPDRQGLAGAYVEALIGEIEASEHIEGVGLASVFFGGGTPTVLSAKQLSKILDAIAKKARLLPETEVTLEANPGGGLDGAYFARLRESGANRLSIGLQAVQPTILRRLGRTHTYEDFVQTLEAARGAGFSNINADLMFALPGQDIQAFRESLECVLGLGLTHVSVYSLIIEEGTPFYRLHEQGRLEGLPGEDEDRAMYHELVRTMGYEGYVHYEISNFAKPGNECVHNIITWTRRDYVGFGIGAHSMVGGCVRWCNTEDVHEYISSPPGGKVHERWDLSMEEQMQEYAFIGLRMLGGISLTGFRREFGLEFGQKFAGQLRRHTDLGLLECRGDVLCLTPRGIDLSNRVLADFV